MGDITSAVKAKAKSFWDTKEGTTGMVIGLGIFGMIGWGAYKVMPYIANLMENTFYAVLFGVMAVALFYVTVIDSTLRSRLWIAYKLMMRAVTYSIIKYDPIGILREIQKKAKDRLHLVDENRRTVKGQVTQIEGTVASFETDERKLVQMVEHQRKNGAADPDIRNNLTKLGRIKEAQVRMKKSLVQTQGFYTQLTRAYKALETIDNNIDFEIGIMEREYKAVTASHAAWQAVRAAFKGSDDMDMLRDETLQFLAEDYGNKLGAIESFMEDSKSFIDGVDLQNSMYADDGMKILEDLNSRDLGGLVEKSTMTSSLTNSPSQTLTTPVGARSVNYSVLKK